MPEVHPLVDVVVPEALEFNWIQVETSLELGPFPFEPGMEIPVAAPKNELARRGWLNIPFPGRPVPSGDIDGPDSPENVNGAELLRAFMQGHLRPISDDHLALVDEVGRCMLLQANLASDSRAEIARDIIARIRDGAPVFDLLLTRAKGRVSEGVHYLEQKKGPEALYEYMLARFLYYGAHLISPTTPGVLFEMGVVTHDLAHTLKIENGSDDDGWKMPLSREALHFLQLAAADETIEEESLVYFLLALNREQLGRKDLAVEDYRRFLSTTAAKNYSQISGMARERLKELEKETSGESASKGSVNG